MKDSVDIFSFIDFKEYLKAWRIAEKDRTSGISHEYLSIQLGQKSRSFFGDIEKGRRAVGSDILDRLIKLIALSGDQAKYFRALVNYAQHSTYKEKEYWFEQIVSLNHTPKKIISPESYSFYGNWYHTAVRALLEFTPIAEELSPIVKKMKNRITQAQATESMQLLKDLSLIAKDDAGYWRPTEKVVSTGSNLEDEVIRRFHLSYLTLLQKIVEEDNIGSHNSTQLTVSVSDEGLRRIEKRIEQFRSEILSMAHKDEEKASRVANISLHAFTLSNK